MFLKTAIYNNSNKKQVYTIKTSQTYVENVFQGCVKALHGGKGAKRKVSLCSKRINLFQSSLCFIFKTKKTVALKINPL